MRILLARLRQLVGLREGRAIVTVFASREAGAVGGWIELEGFLEDEGFLWRWFRGCGGCGCVAALLRGWPRVGGGDSSSRDEPTASSQRS